MHLTNRLHYLDRGSVLYCLEHRSGFELVMLRVALYWLLQPPGQENLLDWQVWQGQTAGYCHFQDPQIQDLTMDYLAEELAPT